MTTTAVQDYLKAIYELSRDDEPAATSAIADRLGLAAGSVTGMLKRLAEQGLIEHVPYYGARLTRGGAREAVRLIRRHRILELFLVEVLGCGWDEVHEEAERLEHVVTDRLIARMAAVLGDPEEDPHGAPIPAVGGAFRERRFPTLGEIEVGAVAVVRRVPDEDAAALRYLAELELVPGAELELLERAPFNGPLRVLLAGSERIVGAELAGMLEVEPVRSTRRSRSDG